MVRIGYPDLFTPNCDEIHISVAFTYDLGKAERMAECWKWRAPIKLGGPALDDPGADFVPGRYLKKGYVITSRGCSNRCWFCYVGKREGNIRELSINNGWNVQDNNLLACSRPHIEAVFEMLSHQSKKAVFSGGFEAARMEPWIAESLVRLNPKSIYFGYDQPSEKESLDSAVKMMKGAGFGRNHSLSAYVLIGYPGDTFTAAEERLKFVLSLGVLPFAMLYRDDSGWPNVDWRQFQREWCRPKIVAFKLKNLLNESTGQLT